MAKMERALLLKDNNEEIDVQFIQVFGIRVAPLGKAFSDSLMASFYGQAVHVGVGTTEEGMLLYIPGGRIKDIDKEYLTLKEPK